MRKLWYAGAVATSGFVLLGATPAHADLRPGTESTTEPRPRPAAVDLAADDMAADDMAAADMAAADMAAADVIGGALQHPGRQPSPFGDLSGSLPLGQLSMLGLLPSGTSSSALQRPTRRQAEAFDGGVPLLGGLAGLPPANEAPRPAGAGPDTSGLPAGGLAVRPARTSLAPDVKDRRPKPAAPAAAPPDDPRLREEPVDGEASVHPFSPDGRPVAGVDEQYD